MSVWSPHREPVRIAAKYSRNIVSTVVSIIGTATGNVPGRTASSASATGSSDTGKSVARSTVPDHRRYQRLSRRSLQQHVVSGHGGGPGRRPKPPLAAAGGIVVVDGSSSGLAVNQRQAANMRERRRMRTINDAFTTLRDRIPAAATTSGTAILNCRSIGVNGGKLGDTRLISKYLKYVYFFLHT